MDEQEYVELQKLFLTYLKKEMDVTANHPDYNINNNNYHLNSENGKLALKVLNYSNKLNELISDLRKTSVFMRRFSNKKFYEENEIDQLAYIKYHYEVFIHKIHTILEIKKIAVNDIYGIGLFEKDCNWNNLKNQPKIKNKPISNIIEIYFKSFKNIILHRHLNTHKAYFGDNINDELKNDFSIYTNAEKYNIDVGEDIRRMMPKSYLEYRLNKYKKERIEYVNNGIQIAEKYVMQFITIITNDFFVMILKKN